MNDELDAADVERITKAFPHNTKEHLRRVRQLLRNARPGNIPWQILENDYGFGGDYSPGDEGEPPQGAKW